MTSPSLQKLSHRTNVLLLLGLTACLPGRASIPEDRILEPEMTALRPASSAKDALELRIQPIQARSHIQTNVLHRTLEGEIQTDPIWTWSVSPSLYLNQALDLVASSDAGIRTMDTTRKGSLRIELLAFEIQDDEQGPWAQVKILARLRGPDRQVQTREFTERVAIQGEMPQSLSKAMGSCLVSLSKKVLAETKKLLR